MRMGKPRIDWVNSCYTLFDNFLSFVSSSVDVDIVVALIVVSSVLLFCRYCRLFLFASAHSFVILHIFIFIHITYVRIVSCVLFLLFFVSCVCVHSLFLSFGSDIRLACISCVSFFVVVDSLSISLLFLYIFIPNSETNRMLPECYKPSTNIQNNFLLLVCLFFLFILLSQFIFCLFLSYISTREIQIFFCCLFLFMWIPIECKNMASEI